MSNTTSGKVFFLLRVHFCIISFISLVLFRKLHDFTPLAKLATGLAMPRHYPGGRCKTAWVQCDPALTLCDSVGSKLTNSLLTRNAPLTCYVPFCMLLWHYAVGRAGPAQPASPLPCRLFIRELVPSPCLLHAVNFIRPRDMSH